MNRSTQVVPNLVRLIEGCRAHGLPVIFTRLVAADADAVSPQAAVTGFWTRAGSPEAEFVPALAPRAGDEVIDKTTVSALARTPLDETLRRIGVRHLLVGGLLATGAVDLTARDAADLGYNVIVVSDACAGETWALHTVVSSTLVGGLIKLRTTSAVLEMLEGSRT
jgi:biuret amidohydrolase